MKNKKKIYTIGEVAELLAVSEKTVRRLITDGSLKRVETSVGNRIMAASLIAYVSQQIAAACFADYEADETPPQIENPRMIKIEAVQGALACSRSCVRGLIDRGGLSSCKIRGGLRVLASSLDDFQNNEILRFVENVGSNDFK